MLANNCKSSQNPNGTFIKKSNDIDIKSNELISNVVCKDENKLNAPTKADYLNTSTSAELTNNNNSNISNSVEVSLIHKNISKEVAINTTDKLDVVNVCVVEALIDKVFNITDKDNEEIFLKRDDTIPNIHSRTENTSFLEHSKTIMPETQSLKSEINDGDNTNFIGFQDLTVKTIEINTQCLSNETLNNNSDMKIEKNLTKNEENYIDLYSESDHYSNCNTHKPVISEDRSEIEIPSHHNSMIKPMGTLYDRKTSSSDYTTETSSQTSVQINNMISSKSLNNIKLESIPIKPKTKTTHLLKRYRRVSPVKQSIKIVKAELYPATLQKFEKPREAILKTFDQLDSSNWEVIMLGLKNMVRLIRYHPDIFDNQMHMNCIQLTRSVRNLRSQVARAACVASTELFNLKSRNLEQECDDLVCALLHRTADTNRFIRSDATRALESMCDNLTPAKILIVLSNKGAVHQNSLVRTTTAKLLNRLVERLGCDKIYTMQREHRDKLFITGANLLLEGSLETRSYAKSLFKLLSVHINYNRTLLDVIPIRTYRNIEKTLKNIR